VSALVMPIRVERNRRRALGAVPRDQIDTQGSEWHARASMKNILVRSTSCMMLLEYCRTRCAA